MADNPSSENPVGVFDSGVGGLSILQALQRHMPAEDFVYMADSAPDLVDSWGKAVARHGPIDGAARFTFAPTQGRTVMLWITDLGDAALVRIGELSLRAPA